MQLVPSGPHAERERFSALFEQTITRGAVSRSLLGLPNHGLRPDEAESLLVSLASLYLQGSDDSPGLPASTPAIPDDADKSVPIFEARYRTLLEQISAIVFMAYLDRGDGRSVRRPSDRGEARDSRNRNGLKIPIRWYQQIHPDDKQRWSNEAAQMLFSGEPLRSVYRVLARDGHTVWFHCEARIVRHADRRPWFIQGVAFDITDLKQTESALQDERNVLSAILDTVGALVVVLSRDGRIVRFNRACEKTTERPFDEVRGRHLWDLFMVPEETDEFKARLAELAAGRTAADYETSWKTPLGLRRISWSSTILPRPDGSAEYVIATGIDITERRRLQKTILEISDQEQRRIGQDLHDGLGQHLTGIAFMSKVLEQKLAERAIPESGDAAKIVGLVNEAITKTRELARGLLLLRAGRPGAGLGVEADRQRCRGPLRRRLVPRRRAGTRRQPSMSTRPPISAISFAKPSTTPSSTAGLDTSPSSSPRKAASATLTIRNDGRRLCGGGEPRSPAWDCRSCGIVRA